MSSLKMSKLKGQIKEPKIAKKLAQLSLMYKVSHAMTTLFDLNKILRTVLNKALSVLKSEIGSIMLLDDLKGELKIEVACGLSKAIVKNERVRLGEAISGWVLEHNEPVLSLDIENDSMFRKKSHERYYTKSFISAPLTIKGTPIGVININNKRSRGLFDEDDLKLLAALANEVAIAIENARLYRTLKASYLSAIKTLAVIIDAKDGFTKDHSFKVQKYALAIAKKLKVPEQDIETISHASLLHDIGKIGIPDRILNKKGRLTKAEWRKITSHPKVGARILREEGVLNALEPAILYHHERYKGPGGYPTGTLKGNQIPLGARIIAVADAYSAMISKRPYRDAYSKKAAIAELKRSSGTHFDPHIVKAFLMILKKSRL